MTADELYNVGEFGMVPSETSVWDLMNRFSESSFTRGVVATHGKVTVNSSGVTFDISSLFGNSMYTSINASTIGYVMFFSGKTYNANVTLAYCGTTDGAAYSQTATDKTSLPYSPYLWRWRITRANFSNNCKIKLTCSSNRDYTYTILVYFIKTGK